MYYVTKWDRQNNKSFFTNIDDLDEAKDLAKRIFALDTTECIQVASTAGIIHAQQDKRPIRK